MAYTLTPNDLFDLSSGARDTVFNHTTTTTTTTTNNNNNDDNNSPPFFLEPLNYPLQFVERYTSPDPVLSAAPPSQPLDSYREPSVFDPSVGFLGFSAPGDFSSSSTFNTPSSRTRPPSSSPSGTVRTASAPAPSTSVPSRDSPDVISRSGFFELAPSEQLFPPSPPAQSSQQTSTFPWAPDTACASSAQGHSVSIDPSLLGWNTATATQYPASAPVPTTWTIVDSTIPVPITDGVPPIDGVGVVAEDDVRAQACANFDPHSILNDDSNPVTSRYHNDGSDHSHPSTADLSTFSDDSLADLPVLSLSPLPAFCILESPLSSPCSPRSNFEAPVHRVAGSPVISSSITVDDTINTDRFTSYQHGSFDPLNPGPFWDELDLSGAGVPNSPSSDQSRSGGENKRSHDELEDEHDGHPSGYLDETCAGESEGIEEDQDDSGDFRPSMTLQALHSARPPKKKRRINPRAPDPSVASRPPHTSSGSSRLSPSSPLPSPTSSTSRSISSRSRAHDPLSSVASSSRTSFTSNPSSSPTMTSRSTEPKKANLDKEHKKEKKCTDDSRRCHYCARPIVRASDRRRHEESSCKMKNTRKFTCEFCKLEVSRKDAASRHYKKACKKITKKMLDEWGVANRAEAAAAGHFVHWNK